MDIVFQNQTTDFLKNSYDYKTFGTWVKYDASLPACYGPFWHWCLQQFSFKRAVGAAELKYWLHSKFYQLRWRHLTSTFGIESYCLNRLSWNIRQIPSQGSLLWDIWIALIYCYCNTNFLVVTSDSQLLCYKTQG